MKWTTNKRKLQMNFKINLSYDSFAIATLVLFFCGAAVRFVLYNTIGKIGMGSLVPDVYVVLLVLTTFFSVITDFKRIKPLFGFLGVFMLIVLYFGMTLLIHPEYYYYYTRDVVGVWDELFSPITGCIYGFMVIVLCRNSECIWRGLQWCAGIDLVYYTIRVITATKVGHWTGYDTAGNLIDTTYDLGVGYSIMFVTIILGCMYAEKKKIVYLLGMIYSLVLVLNNGSRGALICLGLAVFLLLVCISNRKKRNVKQKLGVVVLFVGIILIISFLDQIIIKVGTVLRNIGFNSRTIESMLTGEFLADNGRNKITERALAAIKEGSVIGLGAFGDRPFIAPYYWWGYSHNIALEMLCDFGILLGVILLLALSCVLIKIMFSIKSSEDKYVFVVLLSSCGKLLVSDTIWGYPQFWALLGFICIFMHNTNKNELSFKRSKKWRIHVK